jgi:hypothetical protein
MTKAGWTVLAIFGITVILHFFTVAHFYAPNARNIVGFGFVFVLSSTFSFYFYMHPLAWIAVQLGLCTWTDVFPPDPPRKYISYGRRSGKEEE